MFRLINSMCSISGGSITEMRSQIEPVGAPTHVSLLSDRRRVKLMAENKPKDNIEDFFLFTVLKLPKEQQTNGEFTDM